MIGRKSNGINAENNQNRDDYQCGLNGIHADITRRPEGKRLIKFTILGEPASLKNSRKMVKFGDRPAFIKSSKALNFEASALLQIPAKAKQMLCGDLCFKATIYYASCRPDLDESGILDILQAKIVKGGVIRRGVYLNDRQIKEKHVYWDLDKSNPRVEIEITQINLAKK